MKAKTITQKLCIDDRVEMTATKEAFITLKDHKDNFKNKPTCRLINPSKQEIRKISKQILDSINKKLLNAMRVNQWKNTSSVLQWFKQLPNKQRCAFITFDVVEFYPDTGTIFLTSGLRVRDVSRFSNLGVFWTPSRKIWGSIAKFWGSS